MKIETLKRIKEWQQETSKNPDNVNNFLYTESDELGDYSVLNETNNQLNKNISKLKHKEKQIKDKLIEFVNMLL